MTSGTSQLRVVVVVINLCHFMSSGKYWGVVGASRMHMFYVFLLFFFVFLALFWKLLGGVLKLVMLGNAGF